MPNKKKKSHHVEASQELPADLVIIPPRLTVTAKCFETIVERFAKPREATEAMRDLMAGTPVEGEP